MSGAATIQEAITLYTEITSMLKYAGFPIRKWISNSIEFLQSIPQVQQQITSIHITDESNSIKVLGLQWNPIKDYFSFKVNLPENSQPTKRTILSESSRIFDPLGWISPAVISVKILLQQLWLTKLSWDDSLPDRINKKWKTIRHEFKDLEQINIPRWLIIINREIQLIGFSDASELAYAAVVYCRATNNNGCIQTKIIAAKTRVAPMKQITLPRLELCGALLLCKLIENVKKSLQHKIVTVYAWTDSTIVLSWLSDHPRKWKTFVANRVAEILESIPRNQWNHVSSNQNPADCASRGLTPSKLKSHDIWWHGPSWLKENIKNWPIKPYHDFSDEEAKSEERNHSIQVQHSLKCTENDTLEYLFKQFSSLSKIIKIIAFCHRFRYNPSRKKDNIKCNREPLSVEELHHTTIICIKWSQINNFQEEVKLLQANKEINSSSRLISFNPFLDKAGILRIGGRLQNSTCSYEIQHPVILPKNDIVSKLIIAKLHLQYLHPTSSLLINIIRQKYWIIGCQNMVKNYTHKCIQCFRERSVMSKQLMGSLPQYRVTAGRAFLRTGVDYAGPLQIKTSKLRSSKIIKGYIALFVCMTTKAIHLELVSELSTDSFLAALRRFVARRGLPKDIYSDNGTNFVGANRQLKELKQLSQSVKHNSLISSFLSQNGTNWHFNPPSAPHFGGLWEAGVKSVKHHLVRVIGDSKLTFEEMSTLLTEIESILNSRPLTPLNSDTSNIDVLTPGHFLIGEPITNIPEPNLEDIQVSRLTRWQHIQQMCQGFWKRWHMEYLTQLQQRPKWSLSLN